MGRAIGELLVVVCGTLIIVFAIVAAILYGVNELDCGAYKQATGLETKTAGLSCYVERQGKWYSRDEYKHILLMNGDSDE